MEVYIWDSEEKTMFFPFENATSPHQVIIPDDSVFVPDRAHGILLKAPKGCLLTARHVLGLATDDTLDFRFK